MSRVSRFHVGDCGDVTRLISVLGTGHAHLAVERGMVLLVGGIFCDELEAVVDETRRGPIMLMRSCGCPSLPQGRGCRGTCPGYVGLMWCGSVWPSPG